MTIDRQSTPPQESTNSSRLKRWLTLSFASDCYVVGLAGQIWFILYVGGWDFLPLHIDSEPPGAVGTAVVINLALILLFAVQHSGMARAGFKRAAAEVIPPPAGRSFYVLLSGLLLAGICRFWQPLPGTWWDVEHPTERNLITTLQIFGWVLAACSSFMINHFELFGLQQATNHFRNRPEPKPVFTERLLYKWVRHPLQLGILIGLWATPTMSSTHFMLAGSMTAYIFVGLYLEEKDLVASLGDEYVAYRKRVRMLLPIRK